MNAFLHGSPTILLWLLEMNCRQIKSYRNTMYLHNMEVAVSVHWVVNWKCKMAWFVFLWSKLCKSHWIVHSFLSYVMWTFCFCSKTCLTLAISRIKLVQNKRDMQLKHMRKEIAQFLQTGQEAIAIIRVSTWIFTHNSQLILYIYIYISKYKQNNTRSMGSKGRTPCNPIIGLEFYHVN